MNPEIAWKFFPREGNFINEIFQANVTELSQMFLNHLVVCQRNDFIVNLGWSMFKMSSQTNFRFWNPQVTYGSTVQSILIVLGVTWAKTTLNIFFKWNLDIVYHTCKFTPLNLCMRTMKTKEWLFGATKPSGFTSSLLRLTWLCFYGQESCRNHSSHLNGGSFPFFCSLCQEYLLHLDGFEGHISLPLFFKRFSRTKGISPPHPLWLCHLSNNFTTGQVQPTGLSFKLHIWCQQLGNPPGTDLSQLILFLNTHSFHFLHNTYQRL